MGLGPLIQGAIRLLFGAGGRTAGGGIVRGGLSAAQIANAAARARAIAQAGSQRFAQWRSRCRQCVLNRQTCAAAFGGGNPPDMTSPRGGPYKNLGAQRGVVERHHIPPKGMGGLTPDYGPAIQMTRADHALTPGHSGAGPDYRGRIAGQLSQRGFMATMLAEMGYIELMSQTGVMQGDYTAAMAEAAAYATCLQRAGVIR